MHCFSTKLRKILDKIRISLKPLRTLKKKCKSRFFKGNLKFSFLWGNLRGLLLVFKALNHSGVTPKLLGKQGKTQGILLWWIQAAGLSSNLRGSPRWKSKQAEIVSYFCLHSSSLQLKVNVKLEIPTLAISNKPSAYFQKNQPVKRQFYTLPVKG